MVAFNDEVSAISKIKSAIFKANPSTTLTSHIRFDECLDEYLLNIHEEFGENILTYFDFAVSEDKKSITLMTGNEKSGILGSLFFEGKNCAVSMGVISVDDEGLLSYELSSGTLIKTIDMEAYNSDYYSRNLKEAKSNCSDLILFVYYDFRTFANNGLEMKNDSCENTIYLSSLNNPDVVTETLEVYKPKFFVDDKLASVPKTNDMNSSNFTFRSIVRDKDNVGILHILTAVNGTIETGRIVKTFNDEPENICYLPAEIVRLDDLNDVEGYKISSLNSYLKAVEKCYKEACEVDDAFGKRLYNSLMQASSNYGNQV